MDRLESFYYEWGRDPTFVQQPEKLIFTSNGLKGDWRVMPCVIDRFDGSLIKVVKVIGTNEEQHTIKDKICVGRALMIDELDNHVKASFDVCSLSSFRTAAISALAYKHTTAQNDDRITIIGAGRIGFYLAVILKTWLGTQHLVFHDKNISRAEALARRFEAKSSSLNSALNNCDAIFLCTDSKLPLLNHENSGHASFISSVGADADNLSELESSLLQNRTLVSESRQNIKHGDMARWYKSGLLSLSKIVELPQLLTGNYKSEAPYLFISTGIAVQDALACDFIYNVSLNNNR